MSARRTDPSAALIPKPGQARMDLQGRRYAYTDLHARFAAWRAANTAPMFVVLAPSAKG